MIYDSVVPALCSISVQRKGDELRREGTGFAISARNIMTAKHVLCDPELGQSQDSIERILVCVGNDLSEASIKEVDEKADLAVLGAHDAWIERPLTSVSDAIPEVGSSCWWAGFPILIGAEQVRRLRYAWGTVSSPPYHHLKGFYEVDGNFSPGHSGGPVFHTDQGCIIGVVSRSAGDPRLHFEKSRKYIDALEFLMPYLRLPSELLRALSTILREKRFELPEEGRTLALEGQDRDLGETISIEQIDTLKDVGLDLKPYSQCTITGAFGISSDRPSTITLVDLPDYDSILAAAVRLALRMIRFVEDGLNKSFQMGIGVASGGRPLLDLVAKYQ